MLNTKKKDRAPSVTRNDNDEKHTVDVSSLRSPLLLRLKKHGKQSSLGRLKNTGSEVPLIRESARQCSFAQKVSQMKYHHLYGSGSDLSHQEQVRSNDSSMVANGLRTGKIKCENYVQSLKRRKANQREVIDAACALMKMANDVSLLRKNGMHYGIPDTKKFKSELSSAKAYDFCCHASGKKARLSQMFQRHAREGQMKKIDDPELHIPLLKAIYPDVRKINRRKLVDNLDFKFQKMVKEPPVSSTRKLRFNNVKAESTDSSFLKGRALEGASSEAKAVKKLSFNLISPTVHSGFSFSIIHFLSAIRIAMINSHAEKNGLSFRKSLGESSSVRGACNSKRTEKKNLLQCLTIHEIVEHVRSNPGDPHVLEARETLQDLIRGALIIFSSALGAKGWKALTSYDKSSKHWSWIGPISSRQDNAIKEEISPEAWGLPHRMMVKLVDAYANWLKSVEETLKLIRSLPTPPLTYLYSAGDVEERLKGVRPRKCVATISPCCAEVRAYFHKEEALRYMVPERAFSYTALDGRKSTVSPLRRCSGKPSLKTRDHFMLKSNRPPHFTVLCLVRDAAARLPASIGTRTDVCILVRDSQYIVEDISDEQVNQVVSGALDRLHYEKDPCVQFDRDTKFWIYLHREREEEDF